MKSVDANGTEARFSPLRRQSPLRVAMYSHDTMGLGHMRRNLLLAQKLAGPPHGATVLLIAGACEIGGFRLPEGVDVVALPALQKSGRNYRPRRLGVPLAELTDIRRQAIQAVVRAFQPCVFLADNVPCGARDELMPTLRMLAGTSSARCILGLRDILDDAQVVRREWQASGAEEAVRSFYDAVWVYGERSFFDLATDYEWSSDMSDRMTYTGFLDQSPRLESMRDEPPIASLKQPYAACVVGGGQDGFQLAETFLRTDLPDDWTGVVVAGPCMKYQHAKRLHGLAESVGQRAVFEFPFEADAIIRGAQRVVGMGGYNTLCAILSYGKPALIVPRVRPRREQWMRAQRLQERGLVDVLHPDNLTPQAVCDWLGNRAKANNVRASLDFDGLEKIPSLLADIINRPRRAGQRTPERALGNAAI